MPALWGHGNTVESTSCGDIEQYTKWFEIMEMDFILNHSRSGWRCVAMSRTSEPLEYSSQPFPTLNEALQDIYARIMREIRTPF